MNTTGRFFVVATPLGNLQDISARAVTCLHDVHAIYAEDTRRTKQLLQHLGIAKHVISLHEHNERSRSADIIASLTQGLHIALVTDAGTPAISDPGADVVATVHHHGFAVVPIVGPSALSAALSVAGFSMTSAPVLFVGFLHARGKQKKDDCADILAHPGIVVFFEAPTRLAITLQLLAQIDPERQLCICREMTKLYEEIVRGSAGDMAVWATQKEIRGEISVVIGPKQQQLEHTVDHDAISTALKRCLDAGFSPKDATLAVATILQVSKRQVYAQCLQQHVPKDLGAADV